MPGQGYFTYPKIFPEKRCTFTLKVHTSLMEGLLYVNGRSV